MTSSEREIVTVKAELQVTHTEVFDITDVVTEFGVDDLDGVMEHEEWFGGDQQPESRSWESDTSPVITVTYDDDLVEIYADSGDGFVRKFIPARSPYADWFGIK